MSALATNKYPLFENEILSLENAAVPKQLEQIKDMFLFGCYTGLRYGDLSTINRTNFSFDKDKITLSVKTKKTGKVVNLPLNKLFFTGGISKPEQIVLKYLKLVKGKAPFFQLTNQYGNKQLKKLGRFIDGRTEVKTRLRFHMARHTFGTYLAGVLKLNTHDIMQLMGHSKVSQSELYISLSPSMLNDSLDAANKLRGNG